MVHDKLLQEKNIQNLTLKDIQFGYDNVRNSLMQNLIQNSYIKAI